MTIPIRVSDLWDTPDTTAHPVKVSDLWDTPTEPPKPQTRIGPRGALLPVRQPEDAQAGDAAMSVLRGATLGFGDEALNAARALP